jgi:hypothetical protein
MKDNPAILSQDFVSLQINSKVQRLKLKSKTLSFKI